MAPQDNAVQESGTWELVEGDGLDEIHTGSSCLLEEALSQCIKFGQPKESFVVGRARCGAPKLTAAWSRPAFRERPGGQRFKQYSVHLANDARTQSRPSRTPSPLLSGRCFQQGNSVPSGGMEIQQPPSRSAGHQFPTLKDACRETHAHRGVQPWSSRRGACPTEEPSKQVQGGTLIPSIGSKLLTPLFDRRAESQQSSQPDDRSPRQVKRSSSPTTRRDSSSLSGTCALPSQPDYDSPSSQKSSSSPLPRKKNTSTRNPSPPRLCVPQRSSAPADTHSSEAGEPTRFLEDNAEVQAFRLPREFGKAHGQGTLMLKPLRKLKLRDNKQQRLARVSVHRRMRLQEPCKVNRDKVIRRESIEWAQESFSRYFPSSPTATRFSSGLVAEALADFGVKAETRSEKLVMKEYLAQKQDINVDFEEFCRMVEEVRSKLRITRSHSVFQAWVVLDKGYGGLEPVLLPRLLKDLNLGKDFTPKGGSGNPVRYKTVGDLIADLHKDDQGLVSFQEAEILVQQVREMELARRRKYERELQEKYGLESYTMSEFRSQLIEFHKAFTDMCSDSDVLGERELLELLLDVGILSTEITVADRKQMERATMNYVSQTLGSGVAFPCFLMSVQFVRGMAMARRTSEVANVFVQFDVDHSDALDFKEIYKLLVEISLAPRTSKEQESIAELLEECDADGLGMLEFSEVLYLAQRIDEMRVQARRSSENKRAKELNFPQEETRHLRGAFEMLDVDGSQTLGVAAVEHAVQLMGWRVTPNKLRKLLCEVDDNGSGKIEFIEFLTLMRRIDDELRTTSGESTHITESGKIKEGLSSAQGVSSLPDVDMNVQETGRRRRGPGQASAMFTKKKGKTVSLNPVAIV